MKVFAIYPFKHAFHLIRTIFTETVVMRGAQNVLQNIKIKYYRIVITCLLMKEARHQCNFFSVSVVFGLHPVFVAPALARWDIGVRFFIFSSVRPSVHNLHRPKHLSPFK